MLEEVDKALALPLPLLLVLSLWSFYYTVRHGQVDPHNPFPLPKRWTCFAQAILCTFLLLIIPAATDSQAIAVQFFAAFVVAQIIAAPFTSPDTLTKAEQPSWLRRKAIASRSKIAGAAIAKLISIALAFSTSWLIGDWWIVGVAMVGHMLNSGKGHIAMQLARANPATEAGEIVKLKMLVRVSWFAYPLAASLCAVQLMNTVRIEASSWMSWAGLLGGAIFAALLPHAE